MSISAPFHIKIGAQRVCRTAGTWVPHVSILRDGKEGAHSAHNTRAVGATQVSPTFQGGVGGSKQIPGVP
jgi:hypothetical protein